MVKITDTYHSATLRATLYVWISCPPCRQTYHILTFEYMTLTGIVCTE